MSVDPNIDYASHDPEDREGMSENPAIREAQELEARMRRALATKEDPLRDDESTVERLRRLAAQDSDADDADAADAAHAEGTGQDAESRD